jgi:geranylgeranyl reductase family protein
VLVKKLLYDAIVVGGGPAGTNFAYHAVRDGFSVLLIDARSPGGYKCCAGGLSSRARRLVNPPRSIVEREIEGFLMVSPENEQSQIDFGVRGEATVYRTKFDGWMMRRAQNAGAELLHGRVKGIRFKNDLAEAELDNGRKYRSQLLIGAFGASSTLFSQLGNERPECVIGVQAEFFMEEEEITRLIGNRLEFYFNPTYTKFGYVWIFPKKDGVSVGLADKAGSKGKMEKLWEFIRSHPIASQKLRNASRRLFNGRSVHTALVPSRPLNKTFDDHYLLIGDAAGFVNPTTGEGIYFALKSGEIASDALKRADQRSDFASATLSWYQEKWKKMFDKELLSFSIQRLKMLQQKD